MITEKQLEEWRKLAEGVKGGLCLDVTRDEDLYIRSIILHPDNEFIEASRTAMPLLLDAVEKLTETVETIREYGTITCGILELSDEAKLARSCLEEVYVPDSEEENV